MFILIRKFQVYARKKSASFIVISALFVIFFGAFVMKLVEPQTFNSYFEALWFVCITLTTVGYGDYYPVTMEGKTFALLLILFGIGIIALFLGKFLDFFGNRKRMKEEGKMKFKGQNHLVIVGWGDKAKKAIEEILCADKKMEVVLIDKELEKEPIANERFHFIKGVPSYENTMTLANIQEAKSVIIFANEKVDADDADAASIMIATRVEKMAPQVKTVVEIMDEHNKGNFEHIQVDDFIYSSKTVSHLAVLAACKNGITKAFSSLLTSTDGDEIYSISTRKHWKTYKDAYMELLEEGATLFSDNGDTSINRKLFEEIPSSAELNVICDSETIKKIKKKEKA